MGENWFNYGPLYYSIYSHNEHTFFSKNHSKAGGAFIMWGILYENFAVISKKCGNAKKSIGCLAF